MTRWSPKSSPRGPAAERATSSGASTIASVVLRRSSPRRASKVPRSCASSRRGRQRVRWLCSRSSSAPSVTVQCQQAVAITVGVFGYCATKIGTIGYSQSSNMLKYFRFLAQVSPSRTRVFRLSVAVMGGEGYRDPRGERHGSRRRHKSSYTATTCMSREAFREVQCGRSAGAS